MLSFFKLIVFYWLQIKLQSIYHLSQFGIEDGNYKLVQEVVKIQCVSSKGVLIHFETLYVISVS